MDAAAIKKIIALVLAIIASFTAILKTLGLLNYTMPVESHGGKYLFCYFVGNDPSQERIHLAVSEDGYNFEPLNNNEAIITQTLGKQCVRDPYILRGQDGYFYIIGTDMRSEEGWTSNHALITWKSADLINWTDETVIDIRDFGGEFADTNRAWAPQAIWDAEKQQYMVYWAHSTFSNDTATIYYAYTDDFKTLSEPKQLFAHSDLQTIDADIVYNEKSEKYYMYFKYEENQTIAYVSSKNLTGPYEDTPVVVSLARTGVEGSSIYNITGTDTWVMIMDEYHKQRFFAQQTTDMEHFSALPRFTYKYSVNPRHGSVMAITDEEYDALIKAYGK